MARSRQVRFAFSSAGDIISSARKRAGLTQAELADQLGCSRAWVNGIEHGRSGIPGGRVLDFVTALELEPLTLLEAMHSDWLTR